jgi:hypothetical protein
MACSILKHMKTDLLSRFFASAFLRPSSAQPGYICTMSFPLGKLVSSLGRHHDSLSVSVGLGSAGSLSVHLIAAASSDGLLSLRAQAGERHQLHRGRL